MGAAVHATSHEGQVSEVLLHALTELPNVSRFLVSPQFSLLKTGCPTASLKCSLEAKTGFSSTRSCLSQHLVGTSLRERQVGFPQRSAKAAARSVTAKTYWCFSARFRAMHQPRASAAGASSSRSWCIMSSTRGVDGSPTRFCGDYCLPSMLIAHARKEAFTCGSEISRSHRPLRVGTSPLRVRPRIARLRRSSSWISASRWSSRAS